MSLLTDIASTPQINSLRVARDFIEECRMRGIKIVYCQPEVFAGLPDRGLPGKDPPPLPPLSRERLPIDTTDL